MYKFQIYLSATNTVVLKAAGVIISPESVSFHDDAGIILAYFVKSNIIGYVQLGDK